MTEPSSRPVDAASVPSRAIARRVVVVLALGLVAALGVSAYMSAEGLDAAADRVEHTHAVIRSLDLVRLDTALAGSAARGYALSPRPDLAASFDESVVATRTELDRLRSLTADNAPQTERVAVFARAIDARLEALTAAMAPLRVATPDDPSRELDATTLTSVPGVSYDAAGESVAVAERELLRERTGRADAAASATQATSVAGTLIGLVVLALFFVSLERENQRRAETERALRLENAERGRAEDEAKRATTELEAAVLVARAAEAELDRFFVLSVDMLAIAGVDGYFKRLSPAFDALGYETGELLSKPFLDFVHPDDRERTLAEVAKLADGATTLQFENRYRCRDGSYRWLAWTTVPTPAGLLYATARDVTELKSTNDELQRARDRAEAANKELEAFSYSVSHDLRSPLRAIDGFAAALDEDHAGSLDDEARDYLRRIRAATRRMAVLIDDLIDLARVTRAELQVARLEVAPLAEAVMSELRQREPTREVELVLQPDVHVWADERLLLVVLENLIGNAWKFTGKTAAPRIEVGVERRGREDVLFVRDNGAGFDEAYAGKLFGVFQRLHSSKDFEGTGIGLATVRRVVQRHGGSVAAEGALGRGATVRASFPEPSSNMLASSAPGPVDPVSEAS